MILQIGINEWAVSRNGGKTGYNVRINQETGNVETKDKSMFYKPAPKWVADMLRRSLWKETGNRNRPTSKDVIVG